MDDVGIDLVGLTEVEGPACSSVLAKDGIDQTPYGVINGVINGLQGPALRGSVQPQKAKNPHRPDRVCSFCSARVHSYISTAIPDD